MAWESLPLADEIEVSLFGPGYGESVVVHLGDGAWIVVDSCLEKKSQRSAVLDYFDAIGIDPAIAVRLIVCTHWHDDHMRGIASLLSAAPQAIFACSSALKNSSFLELVTLGKEVRGWHPCGVREIERIFDLLQKRAATASPHTFLLGERSAILLTFPTRGGSGTVTALSPTNEERESMGVQFEKLLAEIEAAGTSRAIPSLHPNLASVVLKIETPSESILLGADMEERNSATTGWKAIVAARAGQPSSLYKIAHHGSHNGDSDDIWRHLLDPDPIALVAPNQRLRDPLPKGSDVDRIKTRTPFAFASAPSHLPKKRLGQPVDRLLKAKGITLVQVPSSQGQIRFRKSLSQAGEWSREMFGRAFHLNA